MADELTRRRFLRISLGLSALSGAGALLAGCPKKTASGPTTASPGSDKPAVEKIKAGLVTDVGGVNDRSFNAQAWTGLQRAGKELGAEIKYVESRKNADYVANLTQFARANYDVVFAVGLMMEDALEEVAFRFPRIRFAIIDGRAPTLSNCVSYKFREEEGSFLAGALAGAMTKTGIIGFVGGMELPLIQKFRYGYEAGAIMTNRNVNVLVGYAGRFDDAPAGEAIALDQMSKRADILYHAAGASGIGVIKAVQNKGKGFYVIGVDKDQDGDAPGRVLTSMVKRVDRAVFEVCEKVAANGFTPGEVVLGLKEDGVGLSPMRYTKKDVPADVLAKIEALKQQIIDGAIRPPIDQDSYDEFARAHGVGTPAP